jgi:3-oxoacyl-[acyl-carrier-protein] synthase II
MEGRQVAIIGTGVVSPFGLSVSGFFEGLATGVSKIREHPSIRDDMPSGFSAPIEGFVASEWVDPVVEEGSDRFTHLALAASQMALADAGVTELDPLRTAIVIGTSMGGTRSLLRAQHLFESQGPEAVPRKVSIQIWPNMAAAQIAMKHKLHGPSLTICTACAASIDAVGNAARLIQSGMADMAITGGAEGGGGDQDFVPATAVAGRTYGMSTKSKQAETACMPFDRDRTGVAGGEGCGFLILEELERAKKRGADIKGIIAGYATAADAYHPSSPDPSGEWEALVIRGALEEADLPKGRKVSAVYAHGTGTPAGDIAEIHAINDVYKDYERYPLVTSLKGAIGHSGGSAASLNMVVGLEGMKRGGVVPTASTRNVDPECNFDVVLGKATDCDVDVLQFNGFGFGGQNASLIVTRPE